MEGDGRCVRDIEAREWPLGRDAAEPVACLPRELAQAFALGPKHQGEGEGQCRGLERLVPGADLSRSCPFGRGWVCRAEGAPWPSFGICVVTPGLITLPTVKPPTDIYPLPRRPPAAPPPPSPPSPFSLAARTGARRAGRGGSGHPGLARFTSESAASARRRRCPRRPVRRRCCRAVA